MAESAWRLPRGPWLIGLGLLIGLGTAEGFSLFRWARTVGGGSTQVTQSVVVDRLQSVAKLVTTEAMLRDVLSYKNTFLGSTKTSLVVVTGKALVGIDLSHAPPVTIDETQKRITATLPHARLIGIEILQMETYDESRGLWNPFHPADRDSIYLLAREQLTTTARELAVLQHAEDGARRVVMGLFAGEGYAVEVSFGK